VPMRTRDARILMGALLVCAVLWYGAGRLRAWRMAMDRVPVAAHRRDPPASAPVNLTKEQALAIVQQALASKPRLTVEKVWVVSLSTRSFFAPDGQPVYVVRVDARERPEPGNNSPPSGLSFDWGVHATTGKLLTKWTLPPEAYAPRFVRRGAKPGSKTQPQAK